MMKKLTSNRKIIIFLLVWIIFGLCVLTFSIVAGPQKLRRCPDTWESGYGMPGGSDYGQGPESRIYIDHAEYDAQQFDQKWIQRNCAVKEAIPLPV